MGLTILPKLGYQPEQLKPEPVRIFTIKNILSLAALLVLGQWKYIREAVNQYRLIKRANSLVTEVKKAIPPKGGSGVPQKPVMPYIKTDEALCEYVDGSFDYNIKYLYPKKTERPLLRVVNE